jgi:hypothetical protein
MKPHLIRALREVGSTRLLEASALSVRHGDLAAAYEEARQIPGLGQAFFTKWLFAWGLTLDTQQRPLVLDENVKAALWELGWSSREAAGSARLALRYEAYVRRASFWAEALDREEGLHSVDGAAVEYALFCLGGSVPRAQRFRAWSRG